MEPGVFRPRETHPMKAQDDNGKRRLIEYVGVALGPAAK